MALHLSHPPLLFTCCSFEPTPNDLQHGSRARDIGFCRGKQLGSSHKPVTQNHPQGATGSSTLLSPHRERLFDYLNRKSRSVFINTPGAQHPTRHTTTQPTFLSLHWPQQLERETHLTSTTPMPESHVARHTASQRLIAKTLCANLRTGQKIARPSAGRASGRSMRTMAAGE